MSAALLQAFDFEQSAVRVLVRGDQPWFVASDVCRALDITNGRDAVGTLEEDEKSTVGNPDSRPGQPGAKVFNIISESGLYALIFKSRKPEARRFRKWVTSEVLPALRTQGAYHLIAKDKEAQQAKRLDRVRSEVAQGVRDVLTNAQQATEDGAMRGMMSMARVRQVHTLGRLRLDALRLLWELETGGHRAFLTGDGLGVMTLEPVGDS